MRFNNVLATVVFLFFTGYLIDLLNIPSIKGEFFGHLTELFPVFISFSIFAMTWYAYNRSKDNHALFMGAIFLIVGTIDLFHTLSYPFMPDFITNNSLEKAALFWFFARSVSAPLFLASVFIYRDTFPRLINRHVLFLLDAVLIFAITFSVLFYQEYLPEIYNESTARMVALPLSVAVILYSSYLYIKRIKRTEEKNLNFLIYGFIIIAFSDGVYFTYDTAGHLLKIAGFYFIHLALYKSSIELPYIKLAEAEEKLLQAAEEKYKKLFDNANDAIITTDLQDRVTSWNKSAERIFGYTAEEIIGKKLSELIVPPELMNKKKKIVHEALAGNHISGIETVRLRRDGTKIDINLTISPIIDVDGKITGLSGIIRDITEQKKAEELHMENERLIIASQAKSKFLAVMSHELRTPLNAILGFSELLKQRLAGELNEKQMRYIDHIYVSGRHLLDLIDDVLDMSRIEAGKIEMLIEKIQVSIAIDEILDLVRTNAKGRNVILIKEIDHELDFIEADRRRFGQILLNLLNNAVKFSKPEGGTVTLTARKINDMARFSVKDTGTGIKEEDMLRLFKTFEQLESGISRKYGGTGLGLVITKQLVEMHGGKIWAESRYGEGSTFTFILPLKAEKRRESNFHIRIHSERIPEV